jgi:DNA-binding NarL/FixJ family response regulator
LTFDTQGNLMSRSKGTNTESSGQSMTRVRLLIADDQPRVRHSLEALLTALRWNTPSRTEIPIEIVGDADDGQQAVEQVQALHPHVVVLGLPIHDAASQTLICGSKLDGLGAIRTIKRRWPDIRIVVLTMYATDRSAFLLAGADAFLLKGCPTSELLEAVMPTVR